MPIRILETGPLLQLLGIPSPRYCDRCGGAIDLTEIVWAEFDRRCADVFLEAAQLRGSRDRDNPRLLRQEPSQRNLRRCRLLSLSDPAKQVNQGLIRFAILRCKARDDVAEVGAVERRILVDLPCEEASPKGTEWNESDSQFLERRNNVLFRAPPPQRIFAL